MRALIILGVAIIASCSRPSSDAAPPSAHQAMSPTSELATKPWRLQVVLDSAAPGHSPRTRMIEGTVTADFSAFDIDFESLLGRSVATGIHFSLVKGADSPFQFTLGELGSDHEVVTFEGRVIRPDSVIGTWEEIRYCCGARGRFTLWRPSR